MQAFFLQVFLPNVANEEAGIAPPTRDRRLYIPSEGGGDEHLLILRILMGEKKPAPSGARTCNLSIAGQHFNQ